MSEPRAACVGHRLDLTEITQYSPELPEARNLCGSCPLLVSCRTSALRETDMAGVAGGMTELERQQWRAGKKGLRVQPATIVDVTPAAQLRGGTVSDLPKGTGLDDEVKTVVLRMTRAGMTADEIVTALDHEAVTHRTVKYVRHRYGTGVSRVDT